MVEFGKVVIVWRESREKKNHGPEEEKKRRHVKLKAGVEGRNATGGHTMFDSQKSVGD